MRLTLRTLLAYLDDILEPSQTKEIGSKLTESKFASDLVERIRDVMRRRRLSAPEVEVADGSLDANVMAAYLDNTLAPEKVTDVEKMCLESDMHLAEAAACHQILTMVLGEPVEIAPDSRRRMYGLVSQGSGDNHAAIAAGKPSAASPDRDELDDVPTPFQAQERTEKIDSLVPEYLRNRPFWKRALVVAVPLALIGVWAGLYITDPANNLRDRWFGSSDSSAKTASIDQNRPAPDHPAKVAKEGATHPNREPLANVADAAAAGGVAKLPAASATGSTSPTTGLDTKQAAAEPPSPSSTAPSLPDIVPSAALTAPAAASPASPSPIPGVTASGNTLPDMTTKPSLPAATTPQVASTSAAKTGGAVPAPPTPGIPGTESKPAAASNPLPAKPDKVTPEAPLDVKLVSKTGVLVRVRSDNRDDWFVLERPSLKLPAPTDEAPEVAKGRCGKSAHRADSPRSDWRGTARADLLAAPEPFDSQLNIGDGLCRVWLIGGTSARLLAPAGASRFGIDVREGRIVLRSGVPQNPGAAYTPLIITLVVRGEQWQLEFLRPETQCGIEITPMFPKKPGQEAKDVSYRGGLYVVEGDRALHRGDWSSAHARCRPLDFSCAGRPGRRHRFVRFGLSR